LGASSGEKLEMWEGFVVVVVMARGETPNWDVFAQCCEPPEGGLLVVVVGATTGVGAGSVWMLEWDLEEWGGGGSLGSSESSSSRRGFHING
jgi:hypothetical protein